MAFDKLKSCYVTSLLKSPDFSKLFSVDMLAMMLLMLVVTT